MFKFKLKVIKEDLSRYTALTRAELLKNCINNKLAYTLQRYDDEINMNVDYLSTKNSVRVLKALSKIQKRNDVKNIQAALKEDLKDN